MRYTVWTLTDTKQQTSFIYAIMCRFFHLAKVDRFPMSSQANCIVYMWLLINLKYMKIFL